MIRRPWTAVWTLGEMPISTMPLERTETIRTPTRVWSTLPWPPEREVPPTTTAVMVVKRRPVPIWALPKPSCAAASTPPSA